MLELTGMRSLLAWNPEADRLGAIHPRPVPHRFIIRYGTGERKQISMELLPVGFASSRRRLQHQGAVPLPLGLSLHPDLHRVGSGPGTVAARGGE